MCIHLIQTVGNVCVCVWELLSSNDLEIHHGTLHLLRSIKIPHYFKKLQHHFWMITQRAISICIGLHYIVPAVNVMQCDSMSIYLKITIESFICTKNTSYFYMFCDWNICDIFQTIICQSFCNRSGLEHINLFVFFLTPNDRYSRFLIVVFNSFARDFVQIKCFTHVANA